jgi:hypothetical protein
MADLTDNPGNQPQLQPPQQLSSPTPVPPPPARKTKFRDKWADHWMARVRTLPPTIYRECCRRLLEGQPAVSVAAWLLTVPNRGSLRTIDNLGSMRRYLELLRNVLREAEKKVKPSIPPLPLDPRQVRKLLKDDRRRLDNVVAINDAVSGAQDEPKPEPPPPAVAKPAVPRKRERRTIEERMVEACLRIRGAQEWNAYVMLGIHDRLELCAVMEEELQMPMQEATRLLHAGVANINALTRAKLAALKLAGLEEVAGRLA